MMTLLPFLIIAVIVDKYKAILYYFLADENSLEVKKEGGQFVGIIKNYLADSLS